MRSFARPAEPILAAEAGFGAPVRREKDPNRILDDLMAAVEALCPIWPPRAGFADSRTRYVL
jgi:hypothetical protein